MNLRVNYKSIICDNTEIRKVTIAGTTPPTIYKTLSEYECTKNKSTLFYFEESDCKFCERLGKSKQEIILGGKDIGLV